MGDISKIRKDENNAKWNFEIAILISGLLLGIGAGWLAYRSLHSKSIRSIPLVKVTSRAALGAQPPNAKGTAGAPVTLEEFSDFQCPPCRDLYRILKKVEIDYGPQLRVVFRHFPITSLHKNALDAARATEAAAVQGRFWEMHDQLFESQQTWASMSDVRASFVEYARLLQLDTNRFQQDMSGPGANTRILADEQRGKSVGVPGTPVVLINDNQVRPESVTYEGIHAAIDAELRRQSACSAGCRP